METGSRIGETEQTLYKINKPNSEKKKKKKKIKKPKKKKKKKKNHLRLQMHKSLSLRESKIMQLYSNVMTLTVLH